MVGATDPRLGRGSGGLPAPPVELPGVVTARLRDVPLLAAWQVCGWAHGATRGPWRGRAVAITCLGVGVPLFALLVALMAVQAASRRSRLYLDPGRTAVLGVTVTRHGWRIENHAARHPGTGAGARLREVLTPGLLRAADRHGVAIYLDAAAPALAHRYARELDGLEDVGPAPLRGRRMRRPPRVGPPAEDGERP